MALASERAFVGAVINGDARASGHGLRPEDFTDGFCRQAFTACLRLEAQGKVADLVTLSDESADLDCSALIDLTQEATVRTALVDQHAANIRGAAQRRRTADALIKAAQAVRDTAQPLEETLAKTRAFLDEEAARTGVNDFTTGEDALVDFALWLDRGAEDEAISTGLPVLDKRLNGGLKPGELYVIGARTSVGKSALMGFVATNAIRAGARVLYESLEMSNRDNISRMIASTSGISMTRIQTRELADADFAAIADAYTLLPGGNFRFVEHDFTPSAIRRSALKMRAQVGLDLIVVDYVQLMEAEDRASSRVETIGRITKALKLLAKELQVPVLTASQVNRAADGRAPRLSDLRESGSIEQDADAVLLMHRPDGQDLSKTKVIELAVAKIRNGSPGMTKLVFDGATMRFCPLERSGA